jgi:uncharacterized membrane protein YkvI
MGNLRGAMFIIGTSIGAGFLSGAELVRFFHTERFLLPVFLSSFVFFIVCVLFLHLGKKYGGFYGVLSALFGKGASAVKVGVSLSSLIPSAGMLAGLDALLPDLKPLLSVLGMALILLCLRKGMKGISILNSLLVPVLLIFIFYYGWGKKEYFYPVLIGGKDGYLGGIVYAFMNVYLAAPVLMDAGKEMKRTAIPAAVAGIFIAACSVCILGRIYREGAGAIGADMPFLYVMRGKKIFHVATALAILTSLASSLYPIIKLSEGLKRGKNAAKGVTLLAAFLLSRLGISGIVRYLYPALGIAGMLLSVFCIFHEYLFKKYDKKIHSGGKNAKNKNCSHHKIQFKHLTAVNEQISKSCAGNDVLAHDRADPRHADVDFQHRNKRGKR